MIIGLFTGFLQIIHLTERLLNFYLPPFTYEKVENRKKIGTILMREVLELFSPLAKAKKNIILSQKKTAILFPQKN